MAGGVERQSRETALYRHFDASGCLLYVGISLSHVSRFAKHRDRSEWFKSIATVTVEWFDTRKLAMAAEKAAIEREHPKFNIAHSNKLPKSFMKGLLNSPWAREARLLGKF
jgi:excinuclease UvrABC nuclease subunit